MMRLIVMIGILMLSGCVSQYSISEREVASFLNKEMGQELNQSAGPLGIRLSLNQVEVQLGHKADIMAVKTSSSAEIKTPLLPLRATLSTAFEAKPWYDKGRHAIFLKDLQLVEVESSPPELKQLLAQIAPQLMQLVRSFLEQQPVYVLDEKKSGQAKLANMIERISVKPGKLVLEFD